ncbi:5'/3'-nucleotidase SurE [Catenovulum sp. 2E275]|uniref:5'/3'-nucleotidase SurE n=1 Tax=Catenovulum sp. 2E275 TaxID=2980497 RepID=UPI0021CE5218|nr:5'/3'-nucleotidase SurE [Catenovulum sp. 2E275]MCU4677279.1 5'/3'-nucleotidase SurE [Catenovulum sp. 2E275]
MSAPCTQQSGKGGSISFLKSVNIDTSKAESQQYCVGDTDTSKKFEDYIEGTPVMAALYGINVAAKKVWGKKPDLVVSGPNEGNNLGFLNNNSGTLGAAMISIAQGIPAIAVSAADGDAKKAEKVSEVVVNVIAELEKNKAKDAPLLPQFTGLNINTPKDMDNHKGIKFTNVGWNAGGYSPSFTDDLSQNKMMVGYMAQNMAAKTGMEFEKAQAQILKMLTGKAGISFDMSKDYPDQSESSEGVAVHQGYITISTIDGNVQANQTKVDYVNNKLSALNK